MGILNEHGGYCRDNAIRGHYNLIEEELKDNNDKRLTAEVCIAGLSKWYCNQDTIAHNVELTYEFLKSPATTIFMNDMVCLPKTIYSKEHDLDERPSQRQQIRNVNFQW